ncbi:basic secretory family protein [Sphingobacterium composti Ten et al. 2007 non Yoo et al. 2007]|uniref:basic secretory family protein n=1 Tax=Sphingobacterium composti TaxID=363260 RepID=UPI001F40555A|nr:basic secretory family protein [Sphingobacterium composti Ten et al. 2007 non Yoo et al. 2007]
MCSIGLNQSLYAQRNWSNVTKDIEKAIQVDTIKKKGITLIYINKSNDFDRSVGDKLKEVFFTNYPKQMKLYNKKSTRQVIFVIDPDYDGIAAAGGGVIRFSPAWFKKNPKDIDIVTHETMHLVQSYPHNAGPGWITEGIADYVRHVMGIDNAGANWSLPEYRANHKYTDAYRITARFFLWLEKNKKKGIMKTLDTQMRAKAYTDDFWVQMTGKNVDELWSEYASNPQI